MLKAKFIFSINHLSDTSEIFFSSEKASETSAWQMMNSIAPAPTQNYSIQTIIHT